MTDEDMQRTLVAEFGPLSWLADRDGNVTPYVQSGYENLSQSTDTLFVEEVHIDLSGYALEKKTFFPYSSFEQRGGAVSGSFADTSEGRLLRDIIIVSSIPLTLTYENLSFYSALGLPGFTMGASTLATITGEAYRINRDPLIHQHALVYSHDTTTQTTGGASIYRVVSSTNASSLEPTAADLLYCYRIVYSSSTDGQGYVPPARVLIPGMISSEPKLEYMMRLKRSYELANQV